MNLFQDAHFIDRGRFATVLKARNINTNQDVALKKLWVKSSLHPSNQSYPNSSTSTASTPSPRIHKNYLAHCVEREIKILRILNNHQNIIKLLDTFNEDEYVIIVLELMNIDLHQLLQNINTQQRNLTEIECKYITKQLFEGLNALHQNNIVHRDLKPANILFNEHCVLKIADLGQARIIHDNHNQNKLKLKEEFKMNKSSNQIKDKEFSAVVRGSQIALCKYENDVNAMHPLLTNEVGTRWYKSPELLYGTRRYDVSIDIWSAGCIIAEILLCKPLFCGETDIDQLCKIFNVLGTINLKHYSDAYNLPDFNKIVFNEIQPKQLNVLWPQLSNHVIDLIKCCLRFNPTQRITAYDALKNEWFQKETESVNFKELNELISNATIQLTEERKKKMDTFHDNTDDDDDHDDVISITSDILNECNLLDLDPKP